MQVLRLSAESTRICSPERDFCTRSSQNPYNIVSVQVYVRVLRRQTRPIQGESATARDAFQSQVGLDERGEGVLESSGKIVQQENKFFKLLAWSCETGNRTR